MSIYPKTLFIFRRDLRLEDNVGLLFALENSQKVIPCFIFTPEQITENPYRSDACVQFMIESLRDLKESIQARGGTLYYLCGKPSECVEECIKKLKIDAVVVNRDYTPYSRARDESIASLCGKANISFHIFDDALLHAPVHTLKSDGKPYTVFTPYFKNALKLEVTAPKLNRYDNFYSEPIPFAKDSEIETKFKPSSFSGGRKACLRILSNLTKFANYDKERDFPALATTHLSAHLKFNTCSVREIYFAITSALGKDSGLIRSLYWRDFFTCIALHFPHVFKGSFRKEFNQLSWKNDESMFKTWCEGQTGIPMVDAGMRELNETGFMHNRLRMITASFLVKDLHIDWRWGEKYFAQKLVDYDPAVNNGNWQWVASTGCDAQPYFRIFNPWTQAKRFDPDCHYIKRWISELSSLTPAEIFKWCDSQNPKIAYPKPIVDHAKETKLTLELYKNSAYL